MTLHLHTRMPLYVMACAAVGVTLLSLTGRFVGVSIVINPTVSEPVGFYRIVNHAVPNYRRGMTVVFPVPAPFQSLVYGRGWLKAGVPLMKNIGALAGDQVCVREDHFEVNGKRSIFHTLCLICRRDVPGQQGFEVGDALRGG